MGAYLLVLASIIVSLPLGGNAKCSTAERFSLFVYTIVLCGPVAFWHIDAHTRNRLMHSMHGNSVSNVDSPREVKALFEAFIPELSGAALYDVLRHELGLVVVRKLRDSLQLKHAALQKAKGSVPPTDTATASKSDVFVRATKEDAWQVVSHKKARKPFDEFVLRSREWNVPPVSATQLVSNSTGVALVDNTEAERKMAMVQSSQPLAMITEKPLEGASSTRCVKVSFTCQDGDKITPKSGFLYQLGSGDVTRVVDQHCAVLKQSVETTSLVCEIEAVEGPTLWKKLRAVLGKTEGDDSANKPAIKDVIRRLIADLGLQAPVDVWLRPTFVHESAGRKVLQAMVRIHTSELSKYLKMSGPSGVFFQEMRTRDSVTDHSVIWLPKGNGCKEALQQAAKLAPDTVFGLARTARSRGVRVLKSAEDATRKVLRPDHIADGLQVTGNWEVLNSPIGAISKEDVRLALSAKWKIRPLFSKVVNGTRTWTVAAEQDPPEPVTEILVDASGNTRMLEIRPKSRKAPASSRKDITQHSVVAPVVVPEVVVKTPEPAPDHNPAEVLSSMKSMMLQTQAMVASVENMVQKQSESREPANVPMSPPHSPKIVQPAASPDGAKSKSRTPRRTWQGTPRRSAVNGGI